MYVNTKFLPYGNGNHDGNDDGNGNNDSGGGGSCGRRTTMAVTAVLTQ
jgi:hypothetical protein